MASERRNTAAAVLVGVGVNVLVFGVLLLALTWSVR